MGNMGRESVPVFKSGLFDWPPKLRGGLVRTTQASRIRTRALMLRPPTTSLWAPGMLLLKRGIMSGLKQQFTVTSKNGFLPKDVPSPPPIPLVPCVV